MGLLAKCPQCSTTYIPGGPCPGCGYHEDNGKVGARDIPHEFAWRKRRHYLAYGAYMCRGLAGGLVGVAAIMTFWIGLFMVFMLILFAAAVAVVSQVVLLANREAVELHCPACEARLDEVPLDQGCCPGCRVRLVI
jgi:hypothetical protein